VPEISFVIPTLRRRESLSRVLGCLEGEAGSFEVVVVADALEDDPAAVEGAVGTRPYDVRVLRAHAPGASAARNDGWRAARGAVIAFLDDDVLPRPGHVERHAAWHRANPAEAAGVVAPVVWAPELTVTPFMRWLETGPQFDFGKITGDVAPWWSFYTANASVKRALIERAGGFDEERFPFGYEDLDLARRMSDHGLELTFLRSAEADHLHALTVAAWREQMPRIAVAERAFVARWPEARPYFYELFAAALARPRARGWSAPLARVVPRSAGWLGARVWASAEESAAQELGRHFMAAWDADAAAGAADGGARR
jgi:GT2 family glycosyltransferase